MPDGIILIGFTAALVGACGDIGGTNGQGSAVDLRAAHWGGSSHCSRMDAFSLNYKSHVLEFVLGLET